jgi:hypothetical protein
VHSPFLPPDVAKNATSASPRSVGFAPQPLKINQKTAGMPTAVAGTKTALATWNYDGFHPDELSFKV